MPILESVCVKFLDEYKQSVIINENIINSLPLNYYEKECDLSGSVTTFKVKPHTNFKLIFNSALMFWNLNRSKYILTDEYFNDLSLYELSLYSFYRHYQPLNPMNYAIVYIVHRDKRVDQKSISEVMEIEKDNSDMNVSLK